MSVEYCRHPRSSVAVAAAGVILGAGFSHLYADAQTAWNEWREATGQEVDDAYPSAAAIAGAVLLALIWVDAVLVRSTSGFSEGGGGTGGGHGHAHGAGPHTGKHATMKPEENGHSHMVPQLPQEVACCSLLLLLSSSITDNCACRCYVSIWITSESWHKRSSNNHRLRV